MIDTATNTVVATVEAGSNPTEVAIAASPGTACPGDCDGDGVVSVSEVVLSIDIALGGGSVEQCEAADTSGDGAVGINEVLAAVTSTLDGCPGN